MSETWNLFGNIWIQNVGDIDLKVISATENSNKFPKTRFWKERSVEDVITIGQTARATLVIFTGQPTNIFDQKDRGD
jgi:hypothetical protein